MLPRTPTLLFLVSCCSSALVMAQLAVAQQVEAHVGGKLPTDPYTKGEEKALQRAGYVAIGEMPWGDDHGSNALQKALPTVPLRFIETRHFRVASALPAMPWPKKPQRRRALQKEIKQLRKRIPGIKKRLKRIDPWLRAHLYASRLERVYTDLSKRLGVEPADFDAAEIRANTPEGSKPQLADGPHFGMRGKFLVLLLNKHGNLVRYARSAGLPKPGVDLPQTHYFIKQGSLFCGTFTELEEGLLRNDHALHCHLVFLTTQCLGWGFMGFQFRPPSWIIQGLAMGEVHRLDPRQHSFRKLKEGQIKEQLDKRWAFNVRRLVKAKAARPLAEMWEHFDTVDFSVLDLMCLWSRVDYLLREEPARFKAFLKALKRRLPVAPYKTPTPEQICAQQIAALREVFGCDPAGFDAGWAQFVLKRYPRR